MSVPASLPKPGRDTAFTGFFSLIATATACAIMALAVARPVEPVQLPPLVLDGEAVRQVLARDRALAREAPMSPQIEQMRAAYLEQGRAELRGQLGVRGLPERRRVMMLGAERVAKELGRSKLEALRAQAVERAMQLLESPSSASQEERDGHLGSFTQVLQRYGLRDAPGRVEAPELCIRAAYKMRWNMLHELPLTQDLTRIERQAHEGWMALHAGALPPDKRAKAAAEFYAAGGKRSAEALAIWLYQGGELARARELMHRAYLQSGELRLRNMELYMVLSDLVR
jgi:hypothetical protein